MTGSSPMTPPAVPVAVVGIGCRFPGGHGVAEFWSTLRAGRDVIRTVPSDRFDVDAHHRRDPGAPGRISTRCGGFVDHVDAFDAGFFGVAPTEAAHLDPQHRLLLETAYEALEDAGTDAGALAGSRTGVFVGQIASDYWDLLVGAGQLDFYANLGTSRSLTSGRLSYAFDLRGPSVTVDTACSSGLTAVHLACRSLRDGESDAALAGAVNLVLGPAQSVTFSHAGMLAPDGRCKFAASSADGFVRSDGVAVVVLKTLARAEADGDDVYAVVLGSAVGSDGRAGGYLVTPSADGQEATLRAAYRNAGVDPCAVGYVEAHGTGTPVGDLAELTALARVMGEGRAPGRPCLVGSVKTNIGHTEATAGLAGLVKAALCLKHRQVPPSLHAGELTTALPWDELPLVVVRQHAEWDGPGPRLAGVSSFGISGANAHLVLAEHLPTARPGRAEGASAHGRQDRPGCEPRSGAGSGPGSGAGAGGGPGVEPEPGREPAPGPDPGQGDADAPVLLPLSARGADALRAMAGDLADFLDGDGAGHRVPLPDVAASAGVRRQHLDSRLAAVVTSREHLVRGLRAVRDGRLTAAGADRVRVAQDVPDGPVRTVFVFPGQGSQWVGMGRELLATSAVFRDAVTACDLAVRGETGWSVLDRLTDDAPLTGIDVVQPTLWAMEVALAEVWRAWGVEPDAVVGHSMGEVAAACVAGALSVAEGAAVICRRTRLLTRVAGRGAMAHVELTAEDAEREIADCADRVSVAARNAPTSTVLSGEPRALAGVLARLRERGVFGQLVRVDVASHSPQVDPLRAPLVERLAALRPRSCRVPLHSTVRGLVLDGERLDADYWAANLREPVRFDSAVATLLEAGRTLFVEVSPHPVLLPAVTERLSLAGRDAGLVIGSLRRDEPERAVLLDGLATAYLAGAPVDWRRVSGPCRRFVRLPRYPWQRERHWYRAGPSTGARGPAAAAPHPLLGVRQRAAGPDQVWRGGIDLTAHRYLLEHRVQDVALLPGTAYLELMVAAGLAAGSANPVLAGFTCRTAMFLRPGEDPTVQVRISEGTGAGSVEGHGGGDGAGGGRRVEVRSALHDEPMVLHATARLLPDRDTRCDGVLPAGPAGPGDPGDRGKADDPGRARAAVRERCAEHWDGADFYARWAAAGNVWGPPFQGIRELWRRDGEALARVQAPAELVGTAAAHVFHPALLDACAQVASATMPTRGARPDDGFVLAGIDRVRLGTAPRGQLWSHAAHGRQDGRGYRADVTITDEEGVVVAELHGLRMRDLEPDRSPGPEEGRPPEADPGPSARPDASVEPQPRAGAGPSVGGGGRRVGGDAGVGVREGASASGPDRDDASGRGPGEAVTGLGADTGGSGPGGGAAGAGAAADLADWLYELRWRPAPRHPRGTVPGGPWLLFADRSGTGAELAGLLASCGHRCVLVSAGDGYRAVDHDRYVIDPRAADDYRRLLSGLSGSGPWRLVHLWGLDAEAPGAASPWAAARDATGRDRCFDVLRLFRALAAVRPPVVRNWVVSRGTQIATAADRLLSPAQGAVWGLGRTAAREHPEWRCTLVDLDGADAPRAAGALLAELAADDAEEQVALRGGTRLVARLVPRPRPVGDGQPGTRANAGTTGRDPSGLRAGVDTLGVLESLRFHPVTRASPPPGEVEIRVEHAGLNYRDVLLALGALPGSEGAPLGYECTGTVTAVGPGVGTVAVGDEVVALAEGAMATYVRVAAPLVVRRPPGLSSAEAATLPIAFLTSLHALCHVAAVREGDRVLIHSATGGVGMAAVHTARWKKLEVYATAGTPERRALLRALGIRHVADSRSLDFVDMVREGTNGAGVQAVLNTLSGAEAVSANLSVVAPFGTYLELTKRDLHERTPIDLRPLVRNVSFSVVDVLEMSRQQPHRTGALLREVLGLVTTGELAPLPYRVFPAPRAVDAFREMAASRHVGKLLLAVPPAAEGPADPDAERPTERYGTRREGAGAERPESAVATAGHSRATTAGPPPTSPVGGPPAERSAQARTVRAGATYLISGGLGGLGLVTAHWLADRGARDLLLVGRSAPPPASDPRLAGLRERGLRVEYAALDVAEEPALRAVLRERAAAGRPPVRGVLHLAGVITCTGLAETTDQQLSEALRPKLDGAWALHQALDEAGSGEPLDFFVLFSSGSSVFASPLLGAYAAGNAALDSFARWRRQAGLHALAVNWGFWTGVGQAAAFDREQGRPMAPVGIGGFSPDQGLRILGRLIEEDAVQAVVLPVDWPRWAASYPDAATSSLLAELVPAGPGHRTARPARPVAAPAVAPAAPPVSCTPSVAAATPYPPGSSPAPDTAPEAVTAPATRPVPPPAAGTPAPAGSAVTVDGASPGAGAAPAEATPQEPGSDQDRAHAGQDRAHAGPAGQDLGDYLTARIAQVLGMREDQVSRNRPLNRQGMDSLMAVAVRTRVQQETGVTLSMAHMLGGRTVTELAAELAAAVGPGYPAGARS